MFEIDVKMQESYDEINNKFVTTEQTRVVIEHSLASVSKWESRWEKAFLTDKQKTSEETLSYIELMVRGDKLAPEVFYNLVKHHNDEINNYIASNHTATRLPAPEKSFGYQETVTAELIYYWMLTLNIPVEYQHWHLNKLMVLIRVTSLKNTPKKKMSLAERRDLNRQRLARLGTQG
jgi:hypothetical protein